MRTFPGGDRLTHCGFIDLGQHRLRQWLVVSPHQAITRTSVDSSDIIVRSCNINLMAIQQQDTCENWHLKLQPAIPGACELIWSHWTSFAAGWGNMVWYQWNCFVMFAHATGKPTLTWDNMIKSGCISSFHCLHDHIFWIVHRLLSWQ